MARGQCRCSMELLEENGKSKRSHGRWVQLGSHAWGLLTVLSSLQAPELLENWLLRGLRKNQTKPPTAACGCCTVSGLSTSKQL